MKYKIMFMLVLLIIAVLTGVFIYRSGNLLFDFENRIINYISAKYELKIDFEKISIRPINYIALKNIKIDNKYISITAENAEITYNLRELFGREEASFQAVKFISINNPVIEIKELSSLENKIEGLESIEKSSTSVKDILKNLSILADLPELEVQNASLKYEIEDQLQDYLLEIDDLSMVVNSRQENQGIKLRGDIQLSSGYFKELLQGEESTCSVNENIYLDSVNVNFIFGDDGKWQGSLQTGKLDLKQLKVLEYFNDDLNLGLDSFGGQASLTAFVSGREDEIEDYRGEIYLEQGKIRLDIDQESSSDMDLIQDLLVEKIGGRILFEKNKVYLGSIVSSIENIPFEIEAQLEFEDEVLINGQLSSSKINLLSLQENFNIPDIPVEGSGMLKINVNGRVTDPEIELIYNQEEGSIQGYDINKLALNSKIRAGFLYLDELKMQNDQGILMLKGLYNLNSEEYSAELDGENIDLRILENIASENLEKLEGLKGRANLKSSISGRALKQDDLTMSGNLIIEDPEFSDVKLDSFETDFYLSEQVFHLNNGLIKKDSAEIQVNGEISTSDIDIKITGSSINLDLLEEYNENLAGYKLSGIIDIKGYITNTPNEPHFKAEVKADSVNYADLDFRDINLAAEYKQDGLIYISEVGINYRNAALEGQARIKSDSGEIVGVFDVNALDYKYLEEADYSIPLRGSLSGQISLGGRLENIQLDGKFISDNTVLAYGDESYYSDSLELDVSFKNDDILVNSFQLYKEESHLIADGSISGEGELIFDYSLNNFDLAHLDLNQGLQGDLNAAGLIEGKIESPLIKADINISDLIYEELKIASIQGDIVFNNNELYINNTNLKKGDSSYNIEGDINLDNEEFAVNIDVNKGNFDDLSFLYTQIEIIPEEYYFNGEAFLQGDYYNPVIDIDISIYNQGDENSSIDLKGSAGREFDLKFKGYEIVLEQIPFLQEKISAIAGRVNFEGSFYGNLNDFNLEMETEVNNLAADDFYLQRIEGIVNINNARELYLKQFASIEDRRIANVEGIIPLEEGDEGLNLLLFLEEIPLGMMTAFDDSLFEAQGKASGMLKVENSIKRPLLYGDLLLEEGELEINPLERFTELSGKFKLKGDRISLADFKGKYGSGTFYLKGDINFYDEQNFDLELTGSDLPLELGSFDGFLNPDLEVAGTFNKPKVNADIEVNNMQIVVPIEWPGSGLDFDVEFDIMLYPGENVYLVNNNSNNYAMNIPVQQGNLNIFGDNNDIIFKGLLTTSEGSFDFYNNKFMLEKGSAVFNEHEGFIPVLNVTANTTLQGTRITLHLDGPANQMLTTFTSSPPLSQEEILELLSSRGGLGEMMSGNISEGLRREFLRLVASELQLDFADKVEEIFKKVFSLDRFEMDAYNFGWDNEVIFYMGKNLSENFNLQYTLYVGSEEEENKISLSYYFDENVFLEGSWAGEDDITISLEANYEF